MITEVMTEKITLEERLARMTRDEFFTYLKSHGLRRGTRNMHGYEAGKRMTFRGEIIADENLYNKLIRWLTQYVGV